MNEESLFHEALARSTPQERSAFLEAACSGEPELRLAVEALLAAHEQSGEFLASPVAVAHAARTPAQETVNLANSTGLDHPPVPTAAGEATLARDHLPPRIGRYQIRRLLGRGGMGAVYLAHDPELDRPVALKVPKLDGPDAEERFLREARAAASVTHPNLCPVYDVGRADGLLYMAMAYVPGPTLTEVIQREGPLSVARAIALAAGVARGMAEAHRHGIIHRDLKPGNILLDRKGEPVITDFGLALRASTPTVPADAVANGEAVGRLTEPGVLMGTPAYMPPEQARGDRDRIGPASDVYALGAILFELLTGRPVFATCPLLEMVKLIETQPVPAPSTIRRAVPAGLDAICRKALAKDPKERYASMEEFGAALAELTAQARRRRLWSIATAAALALLLAVAGVVLYVKTDNGTVEIRINDPAAGVKVSVDGNEITLTDGSHVTKLRAGPHALLVKGDGFETETRVFKVTRGKNVPVQVELKPTGGPVAGPPDPKTKAPAADPPSDRAALARLLTRGGRLIAQGQFGELETVVAEALKIDPQSPGAGPARYRSSCPERYGRRPG